MTNENARKSALNLAKYEKVCCGLSVRVAASVVALLHSVLLVGLLTLVYHSLRNRVPSGIVVTIWGKQIAGRYLHMWLS